MNNSWPTLFLLVYGALQHLATVSMHQYLCLIPGRALQEHLEHQPPVSGLPKKLHVALTPARARTRTHTHTHVVRSMLHAGHAHLRTHTAEPRCSTVVQHEPRLTACSFISRRNLVRIKTKQSVWPSLHWHVLNILY